MMLLDVKGLKKHFGGIKAVNNISLKLKEGTINGLIGPNGSGKTTLFDLLSGFHNPDSGRILFKGENIAGLQPHAIFRKGICRTFQISDIRARLTVLENMLLAKRQTGEKLLDVFLRRKKFTSEESFNIRDSVSLLKRMQLKRLTEELGGVLSGGQRKLLQFAMIWEASPELFLLDEPIAGVNPTLANDLLNVILELNKQGKTFLIVEHNMKTISKLCNKVFVLCSGEKIAEGTPGEIQQDDNVLKAYLSGYKR